MKQRWRFGQEEEEVSCKCLRRWAVRPSDASYQSGSVVCSVSISSPYSRFQSTDLHQPYSPDILIQMEVNGRLKPAHGVCCAGQIRAYKSTCLPTSVGSTGNWQEPTLDLRLQCRQKVRRV